MLIRGTVGPGGGGGIHMSKDNSAGNTRGTKLATLKMRRAQPVYLEHTSVTLERAERRTGFAVIVRVSAALLAQSRRDGGIAHQVGALELADNILGLVVLRGGDELHCPLFDPAEPIVRDILAQCERSSCFLNIFLPDESDIRLPILPYDDQMRALIRNASRCAPGDVTSFAEANLALAEQLRAAQARSELAGESTPDVVLHSLLTDQRFDEAERMAAGDETKHVIH